MFIQIFKNLIKNQKMKILLVYYFENFFKNINDIQQFLSKEKFSQCVKFDFAKYIFELINKINQ